MNTLCGGCPDGSEQDDMYKILLSFGNRFRLFTDLVCQSEIFHTEDEIDRIQGIADRWTECIFKLGLSDSIGNYTHAITAGHVTNQLRRHGGNIYRFSAQDVEGRVKDCKRDDIMSQKGGRCGGTNKEGGRGKIITRATSSFNKWSRRWITVGNGYKYCNEGKVGRL